MDKSDVHSIAQMVTQIAEQPLNNITYDDDLLACGYLDSFGFIQLILQLQDQFNLKLTEETQLDIRLRSINGILELVKRG
jgi:acyl carrier protein